jgi:hypothetical protein
LPDWLSDALCVVATGGGLATRELYSDRDETLLDAQRPVLVNGIDNIGRRDDYRDRCLRVFLPKINEQSIRGEATLLGEFETERPKLLGALLDAAVAALKHWDTTKLEKAPRMADFARWVVAAESGGGLPWKNGGFLSHYLEERGAMAREALEGNKLADALIGFMADKPEPWCGSAEELRNELNTRVDKQVRLKRYWPKTPRGLSGKLRRLAADLRRANKLDIQFGYREGHEGKRVISIERFNHPTEQERESKQPAAPAAPGGDKTEGTDFKEDSVLTIDLNADDADANADANDVGSFQSSAQPSARKLALQLDAVGADDTDDTLHNCSYDGEREGIEEGEA